jgi:hypothetical protein
MDQFKYVAIIAAIDSYKYIKDLEHKIRCLVPPKVYFRTDLPENCHLSYKAYAYALNKFAEKSKSRLPEFIYDVREKSKQRLLYEFIEAENPQFTTYEELIDIFEFDKHITPSYTHQEVIPRLHSIVGNRPIHFTIAFDQFNCNNFNAHSIEIPYGTNQNFQQLVRMTRHKQVLSPNSPSTIIDQAIAYWSEQLSKQPISNLDLYTQAADLLEQQTTAIKSVLEELKCNQNQ